MDALERELLDLILDTCNIPVDDALEMSPDAPLIGPESPLGTDSIDALQIAVAVRRHYGVRMDSEHTTRDVLRSLRTLSAFVRRHGRSGR